MRNRLLFFIGMLILIMLKNAYSQDVKIIELEPITVTAARAPRKIMEVPANVSILSAQEIAQTNAKNISDLLKNALGVYTFDASGTGSVGAVNMRGFYGSMSSHQLVLVDGIPQNKGKDKLIDWDLISLDNVEKIEIVRGPGSALYGDNAMSGVINIITKKLTDNPELKLSASYGSFDTREQGISTSGAYKQLGYFLGISHKDTQGFREHNDYDRIHIDGKLDYAVNDGQSLKLSFNHYEKERGALPWALTEAQLVQNRRQARPGTENDKSDEAKNDISITHLWNMSILGNTEATFYCKYDDADSFYTSGSAESTKKEQIEDENAYGILLKDNLSQEILGFDHEFTIGIDLERDNFDYQEYKAPYLQRGILQSYYGVERDKFGPYFQDEIKFNDSLRLIGGIRYDKASFDFDDQKTIANSRVEKMSKIIPKCGLVYTYRKNCGIYANYAQAFRTPTIGQMFTYGSMSNPDLKPEEAVNYEIGFRHYFNEFLKANLSFYQMKLDNEIWYDYAAAKYQNYGRTSHKGIETSLDFKIIKWLSGFANYAYSRAKNENGSYDGKYLTNIPMHKAGSGLHFDTNFGLSWDIALTYFGTSYINSTNSSKLLSYAIADTKVSYEYKMMKIFLAVDNFFDKKYNSYGFVSGTKKYFNPAPGRVFTAGVEMKF